MRAEILDLKHLKLIFDSPTEAKRTFRYRVPKDLEDFDAYIACVSGTKDHFVITDRAQHPESGWYRLEVQTDYLDCYWKRLDEMVPVTVTPVDFRATLDRYDPIAVWVDHHSVGTVLHATAYYPLSRGPMGISAGTLSDALAKSQKYLSNHMDAKLGEREHIPEFIHAGYRGGEEFLKRNPRYPNSQGKIHRHARDPKVWKCLWQHWLATQATPEYQTAVARFSMQDGMPLLSDYTLHLDKWATHVRIEDFRAGNIPEPKERPTPE